MDLHARKISFIQDFLNFQNEEIIIRFEKLLKKEKTRVNSKITPFSLEEFNERIDASLDDSNNDRVTESSDLASEIEKWS